MADLDTAAKRFSMFSFADQSLGMRIPDATDMDEAADRQGELFLYSGFDVGAPTSGNGGFVFDRRRRAALTLRYQGGYEF